MTKEEASKYSDQIYTDDETGEKYPLFEADYDWAFPVYKSDRKKAVIGDPYRCIEALGACKLPNVLKAFIGSAQDAYLMFGPTGSRPFEHALHFVIPAKSAKVRDLFDRKGSPKSQILPLKAPTKGRTLKARKLLNARRRAEIKNGTGKPVVHRGRPNMPRILRIGAARRPTAQIETVRR